MTGQDRKRSVRISGKSPIATPPRVAITGRSPRTEAQSHSSTDTTPSPNPNPLEPEPAVSASSLRARSKSLSRHQDGQSSEDPSSRIAMLEIELAETQDAFSQELSTLGNKLAASNEAATYWQGKHTLVQGQFLQVDTEYRVLQHENAVKAKAQEERDRDVKTRISSLILDRDTFRDNYRAAKRALHESEREVERLSGHVKGLKDFVSTSSRVDGQVTDESIGELMRSLGNSLQNWVIVNFRKAKIDLSSLPEEIRDDLQMLVPNYEDLAATAKIHLIQSVVSRLLVIEIFERYYVGLPEDRAVELHNLERYLHKITGDSASGNQMRAATLSIIHRSSSTDFEENTNSITSSIIARIEAIVNLSLKLQLTESGNVSLRAIISNAIDLSRLMRVQKAVFQPIMPVIEDHQVTAFDVDMMEDIGGEDEENLEGRELRCVTFPGVIKKGDINGEHTSNLRNVIAKARILCLPD